MNELINHAARSAGVFSSFRDQTIMSAMSLVPVRVAAIVSSSVSRFPDGGAGGSDTIDYHRMTGPVGVTVDLVSQNSWDGVAADFFTSIENAIGSDQTDTIFGNAVANILEGRGGTDFIIGGGGTDTASYRSSSTGVTVDLSAQNSWDGSAMDFLSSIEDAIGSAQTDTLVGNSEDNTFEGLGGTDYIIGGAGSDAASYRSATGSVTIDLAAQNSWDGTAMDFFTSIENAIGSNFIDTFVGDGTANIFEGLGGTDYLNGAGGSDTASYRSSNQGVTVDLASQNSWDGTAMDFLTSIENAIGSAFTDTLVGDGSANVLEGLGGLDYIQGGGGSDTASYRSAEAGVTVDLASQNSWDGTSMDFFTSIENATGSAFSDVLFGSSGDNAFEGLGGNDIIVENGGNDTFRYASLNVGTDTITDFDADAAGGQDFIDVSGRGFSAGSIGSTIFISSLGGTSSLIEFVGGGAIILNNVKSTDVTAADFIF